jgi:hypothetical protein
MVGPSTVPLRALWLVVMPLLVRELDGCADAEGEMGTAGVVLAALDEAGELNDAPWPSISQSKEGSPNRARPSWRGESPISSAGCQGLGHPTEGRATSRCPSLGQRYYPKVVQGSHTLSLP